jgi:hypothetical protein
MNADEHPLMRRFHKPGDEKRALVIVPRSDWDEWLSCKRWGTGAHLRAPHGCRADEIVGGAGTAQGEEGRSRRPGAVAVDLPPMRF